MGIPPRGWKPPLRPLGGLPDLPMGVHPKKREETGMGKEEEKEKEGQKEGGREKGAGRGHGDPPN